ncbi:MAG TPA: hypothetical protein VHO50_05805 [Bacteroidales bacterium]|nr:hypothetical protein [Bacteroidales bacterium]
MKNLQKLMSLLIPVSILFISCEGPQGQAGRDANETCMECHNRDVVDKVEKQYTHSEHFLGEAFEEAGARTNCAPCHTTDGFLYVVEHATPVTNYVVDAATASLPGRLECYTCHSKIHTTFTFDDFELTTTDPVPMLMWAGKKTLDFQAETSNLCAKCHQPRQVAGQAGTINYDVLVSEPNTNYTLSTINYRTGVHYGTESAMNGGQGGIEFGTDYDRNHPHSSTASCATCHMAEPSGVSGGHSFIINFNGCNVQGCHSDMDQNKVSEFTEEFDTLLETLANELNAIGGANPILQRDPADNEYHGYIDIFDAQANPTGYWGAQGNPPFPMLTNEQFGAFLNFQLLVRDGSHGIHNPDYMMDLLEKTVEAL